MSLPNYFTLNAVPHDPGVGDAKSTAEVPGGRLIAVAIAEALQARGMTCTEVVQHQFYGWSFEVRCDGSSYWCLLQDTGKWLLIAERRTPLLVRLFGRGTKRQFKDFLDALAAVIDSDSRFMNCNRWTRDAFEADDGVA